MKIAIHSRTGSFSDRWIEYCTLNNVPYKIVDCLSPSIIDDVKGCDMLMWHWHHHDYKSSLFAKQLIISIEKNGVKVFPSIDTAWHFDDKIGQKYLLESLALPLVKTEVFYTKSDSIAWANATTFPKVFKLRGGAGSSNVKLINTKTQALAIINRAFKSGFNVIDRKSILKDRYKAFIKSRNLKSFKNLLGGIGRLFFKDDFEKNMPRERGYVYFQEFLPNNNYDIRIIVIGARAFGIRRFNRENDFRASGSGKLDFDHKNIDLEVVRISFDAAKKLNSQCTAFDFILDIDGLYKIVEISFGFTTKPYDNCPGYWLENLEWIAGSFNPQHWMVEDLINSK